MKIELRGGRDDGAPLHAVDNKLSHDEGGREGPNSVQGWAKVSFW